jgi:kynurenine formamidase
MISLGNEISFNKIVDLTHKLTSETKNWRNKCGFNIDLIWDYSNCTTDVKFRVQSVNMNAGIGTHMDSPAHCFEGMDCIGDISISKLISKCLCINVSNKVFQPGSEIIEDYAVCMNDMEEFILHYGDIEPESVVVFYTGWSKFWNTDKYHNNYKFPHISREVAEFLVEKNIRGIGIDTLSPDMPENWHCHQIFLSQGMYIIENIANIDSMPNCGGYLITLPINSSEIVESPVRIIGAWSDF